MRVVTEGRGCFAGIKMRRCRATFMDDWLKKTFDRLGRAIGEQPGYFLIVPILLSALCASGFQRVKFMADPEYLFRYHINIGA